ncbi:MAG: DUF6092 family protein [Candidatus Bathyarchaeia archaeon]
MSDTEEKGGDLLFELALFLLTSARGSIDEPQAYGTVRLLEALSRLIELTHHVEGLKEDRFLNRVKEEVNDKKLNILFSNRAEFIRFLDELILKFVDELERRMV